MSTTSLSWPAVRLALERRARRVLSGFELDRTCVVGLVAAITVYAAVAIYLTRGTTLFVDEVSLFLENRGLDPRTLLEPLNGHIIVFSRLVYAIGYELVGPASPAYRAIEVVGGALASGFLFAIVRRRVGAPLALAAAILVLFLGSAWEVILVPSGYPNVYAVTFGLGAWLALDRGDRRGDLAACALLVAATAVSDLSLAFVVGALLRILLEGPRRRAWIPVVPLVLYTAWFAAVQVGAIPPNGASTTQASNLLTAPNYVFDEASAVAGALAGLNYDFGAHQPLREFSTSSPFGPPLAALGAAGIVWAARRRSPSPRLWGAVAILAAFWLALALSFGQGRAPTTVRYAYPSAVFIFVLAAEAGTGQRVGPRVLAAAYGLLVFALGANLLRLDDGARFFRNYSTNQRAELTAIEAAGAHVEPSFQVSQGLLLSIGARKYLAAVRRNGSPAFSPPELEGQPETVRAIADSTLVSALGIELAAAPPRAARWPCRVLVPPEGGSATAIVQPPRTLALKARGGRVALRRFASTTTVPIGQLSGASELRLPPDAYRGPWYLSVSGAGRVSVCTRQR